MPEDKLCIIFVESCRAAKPGHRTWHKSPDGVDILEILAETSPFSDTMKLIDSEKAQLSIELRVLKNILESKVKELLRAEKNMAKLPSSNILPAVLIL